ncbi:MAG TPA: methyl-accepting chemotaxis protein [Burkholderiaceae bacterium]|nr:methyl-accepting chemotaxis protein [Burkholderiaceae bacterium]
MKLRTQIVALGLAGTLMAAMAGGIGLASAAWLGDALEGSLLASQALRASQEADMMHDAIRGDGQLALLGALQGNPAGIEAAGKGLKEHGKTFSRALDELQNLPQTPQSRAALAAVQPLVNSYMAAANRLHEATGKGQQPPQEVVQALQATFEELEGKMAALSDSIEQHGDELNRTAKTRIGKARLAISATLALCMAAMLGLSFWLAHRIRLPMAHAVGVADRLAQGDLTASIEPAGNEETAQLLRSLKRMQAGFAEIVREVKANADAVASASQQIARGNQDLSGRTGGQASALQETAATMEQLGTTVRHNAESASQANRLALDASSVAGKGGEVMKQVVHTMTGINESSRRIADIIGVIDGMAFQTNILALNAAVESARAGEQGRGFAVVASEVRSLAQRSAAAAREVKNLVSSSVVHVEQGSALVDQAGQTMQEIVGAIGRVTDIVAAISSASEQQSKGVSQVSQAVSNMDQATQTSSALIEQTAAAAESLDQQARQLVQAVAAFRLDQRPSATGWSVTAANAAAAAGQAGGQGIRAAVEP